MAKICGVSIDKLRENNVNVSAGDILDMNADEKFAFVEKWGSLEDRYTIEGFLYYLNQDLIDTENY